MAPSRGPHVLCVHRTVVERAVRASLCTRSLARRMHHAANHAHRLGPRHQLRSSYASHGTCSNALLVRRGFSSFTDRLKDPANKLQSYVSSSSDPYLNLSIEDHILRNSPADSTILFLYVNRPCVVIGRNQNPWTEVNLGILNAARDLHVPRRTEPSAIGDVDLVRRRSGGGTVFHDEGNLNWSITCPRTEFTRDKHAEMTVLALRKCGIERARVNERHDIVLDQGLEAKSSNPEDTHRTPYTVEDSISRPLKVSGSAYKLTRQRALHHATTLLSSPNLHIISDYLRSPAKKLIQAKGVESVSSPVANIGLGVQPFQQCLQQEFVEMYTHLGAPAIMELIGDDYLDIPDIRKGYDELRSEDWMWSQTPQFDLSLPLAGDLGIDMNIHHGIIKSLTFKDARLDQRCQLALREALVNQKLHEIRNWLVHLQRKMPFWRSGDLETIGNRLNEIMPIPVMN